MKRLMRCDVVLAVLLLSGIIALVGWSSPAMSSTTYDLSGDWGTNSSVWSYGTGWEKEISANPGSWAAGDIIVSLGSYPAASMVTWRSPTNGTINIAGAAWPATSGTDNVYLQLIPKSLAGSLSLQNVLQSGTTSLANGTVQAGYSSVNDKSSFGSPSIPLRDVTSLTNLPVKTGDVVALMVMNMSGGNYVGAQLTINETPSSVPIPAAIWLFGAGLVGLVGLRRKFSK